MDSKETKNIWVAVFVIALIIGGAYYFSTNSSTSPANPTENTQVTNSLSQPEITKSSCEMKAGFDADKAWIRACNLQGLLTASCQQLFDSQGFYLVKNGFADPNASTDQWLAGWKQYNNDRTACSCSLPPVLAKQLNDSYSFDVSLCANYPTQTKGQKSAMDEFLNIIQKAKTNEN